MNILQQRSMLQHTNTDIRKRSIILEKLHVILAKFLAKIISDIVDQFSALIQILKFDAQSRSHTFAEDSYHAGILHNAPYVTLLQQLCSNVSRGIIASTIFYILLEEGRLLGCYAVCLM
jgi:hypothetical protein